MNPVRRTAALALALAVVTAACGDDGNDRAALETRAPVRTTALAAHDAASSASSASVSDSTVGPSDDPDGGPSPTTTAVTAAEPTGVVVEVTALDNSFRPDVVLIDVGDEVVWENRGINDHNVLDVDGDDWGVEVEGFTPGAVYSHVFTEPGEYRYYCSIHGNEVVGMVGTVVVNG